jgi:hypothetical protein
MQDLAPKYLSDLATQIGFLSAFLGGFAATLLGVLLIHEKHQRVVTASIALATLAAVSFIAAVIASTQLIAALHPDAPGNVAHASLSARILCFISFGVGVYSLIGCIGLAGWIRSRGVGVITTLIAVFGAILVTLALAGV